MYKHYNSQDVESTILYQESLNLGQRNFPLTALAVPCRKGSKAQLAQQLPDHGPQLCTRMCVCVASVKVINCCMITATHSRLHASWKHSTAPLASPAARHRFPLAISLSGPPSSPASGITAALPVILAVKYQGRGGRYQELV